MVVSSQKLYDRSQSVKECLRLSLYIEDLKKYKHWTLKHFFDFVRKIPYKQDTKNEIVSRPAISIETNELDCKKKCILIIAFARLKKIPFRIITMSNKPSKNIHHIFPQLNIDGKWINYDATYRRYNIAEPKRYTNIEVWDHQGEKMKLLSLEGDNLEGEEMGFLPLLALPFARRIGKRFAKRVASRAVERIAQRRQRRRQQQQQQNLSGTGFKF